MLKENRPKLNSLFDRGAVLVIAVIYFIFSILLTWPLVFQLKTSLFGDYGDARGEVWKLWAKVNGLYEGPTCNLIAAPFGIPTDSGFSQPFTDWIHLLLARMTDEVVAHNLVVLFAFPLTALAMYALLNYLLKNKMAAFFGGLQFGFAPVAVMQATGGHSSLATNFFIPLLVLALFYNQRERSLKSAVLVGVSYSFIVFTAMYMGYFALYLIGFFVAIDIASSKGERLSAKLLNIGWGALTAVILVLPFVYRRIFQQLVASAPSEKAWRPFFELEVYSARFWEYLLPSVDHPFLGRFVYDFVRSHLHGSNVPEQTLYLGFTPLLIAIVGCILLWGGRMTTEGRRYFYFFGFGALMAGFLSLPPEIKIGALSVPTFSGLAYQVAPMFRVYSRFGILVNLFLAGLVALSLAELSKRVKPTIFLPLFLGIVGMLSYEYWSVPPHYASIVEPAPEYAHWLEKQSGDFVIAEYPMMRWEDLSAYTYQFWQRVHKKRMVNGAWPWDPVAWNFYEGVKDLSLPGVLPKLKSVGVKYLVVHLKTYSEGPVPAPIQRYFPEEYSSTSYGDGVPPALPAGLKMVFSNGSDLIFQVL